MRTKIKSIISSLLLMGVLSSAPPVLNVYVIPFDNIKNDVAIGWLSDAFAEMINAELTEQDRIYLKGKAGLEEVMTNRSLLLQQRPGTKNLLILGKFERSLDKISISVQLIDISSWDELGNRKMRGNYNDVTGLNRLLTESVNMMMTPYLPKAEKSIYPTLTEGKRMRNPPTYAEKAIEVSSAIDEAIIELEKKLDISIGARGEEDPTEAREEDGEWVLDLSKDNYEDSRTENEFNTSIMVDVLSNLMSNPYQVKLDRPQFNYDPDNRKEFQITLPVNYKLKATIVKEMLESLPYSGIKQDGNLTVFYFNRDKYNFPKDISDNIQRGKYRSIPVIQLLDEKGNPVAILVDTPDHKIHGLSSDRVVFRPFRNFSPLIDFTVGGWSMQVSLETVDIPVEYRFKMNVSAANNISRVSLKFVPEGELHSFLSKLL
jgi:TolB-like protein|tara:strand:+ start:301 stop:1593 length:1293 start_codon:yes stop_codon:yes gene_type:complete